MLIFWLHKCCIFQNLTYFYAAGICVSEGITVSFSMFPLKIWAGYNLEKMMIIQIYMYLYICMSAHACMCLWNFCEFCSQYLSGFLITTAWSVLRLWMEKAPRYGGWLQTCWINSHGQLMGVVLHLGRWAEANSSSLWKAIMVQNVTQDPGLNWLIVVSKEVENGHEIWNVRSLCMSGS